MMRSKLKIVGLMLFVVFLGQFIIAGAANAEIVTDGLWARYSYGNDTGDTVIDDSGNGFNGTNYGSTLLTLDGGAKVRAFNGTWGYIDIGTDVANLSTDDFTIQAWVCFNTTSGKQGIISTNAAPGISLGNNAGYMWGKVQDASTNSNVLVYPNGIVTGRYMMVTFTRSSGVLDMWYNGGIVSPSTPGASTARNVNTSASLLIGHFDTSTINGYIGEVRIYKNKVLTPAEIRQNYESDYTKYYNSSIVVNWSATSYTATRGSPINITLSLSQASNVNVTVEFTLINNSAAQGVDYNYSGTKTATKITEIGDSISIPASLATPLTSEYSGSGSLIFYKNGRTMNLALAEFPDRITPSNASWAISFLATNDYINGDTSEQMIADMQSIIDWFTTNSTGLMLFTIPGCNQTAGKETERIEFNQWVKDYCNETHTPIIDAAAILEDPANPNNKYAAYTTDGTHWTAAAYTAVFNNISYVPSTYRVTIPAGETSKNITIDTLEEGTGDTFNAILGYTSDSVRGTTYNATITIQDAEPPTVDFTADTTSGTAPLTVQFTFTGSDADTYEWDFGDGTANATTENPSHEFASANSYTITLTVTNTSTGLSNSSVKIDYITVSEAGDKVVTLDNATMYVDEDVGVGYVVVTVKRSGNTAGGCWFTINTTDGTALAGSNYTEADGYFVFNDSETEKLAIVAITNDTFYSPGKYFFVNLTATNGTFGSPRNGTVTIIEDDPIPAPVASFTAENTTVYAFTLVNFTDTSTGIITGHQWSFGDDGENATTTDSYRMFGAPGTYTVILTVSNSGGSNSTSSNVTVIKAPPDAYFLSDVTSGTVPLTVQFTNFTTYQDITNYEWDFNDGSPNSTDAAPSHTFSSAGTYTVIMTVSNATMTSSYSDTITVNDVAAGSTEDTSFTLGLSDWTITIFGLIIVAMLALVGFFVLRASSGEGNPSAILPIVVLAIAVIGAIMIGLTIMGGVTGL